MADLAPVERLPRAFVYPASGVVIAARANSAKADYGSSYLLLAILICVLGGINPF